MPWANDMIVVSGLLSLLLGQFARRWQALYGSRCRRMHFETGLRESWMLTGDEGVAAGAWSGG